MNLCIDVGNTRVKLAVLNATNQLMDLQFVDVLEQVHVQKMLEQYACRHAIISSVRGAQPTIKAWLAKELETVLELTATLPVPIQNRYKTPKTLGKDRLAGVVGAMALYPDENVLVVDAGTCITYDFISKTKDYWGGNILPGIVMRFKSMAHFTAKLPLVAQEPLDSFIGNSTKTAMQTGVLYGVLHELSGFKQQYEQQFGHIRVIVTGGDASYFESQFKNEIFAQPNLVLIGLNKILNYNIYK